MIHFENTIYYGDISVTATLNGKPIEDINGLKSLTSLDGKYYSELPDEISIPKDVVYAPFDGENETAEVLDGKTKCTF